MTKLKLSAFGVLFWVWFWFCFNFATQSDFKKREPIFHQNYHAGFKVESPPRDFSIFSSLQSSPFNGSRAASASQGKAWDSASFPFVFHFREESITIPKKAEKLILHLKSTVSNPRQKNLDEKGNKRSSLWDRFAFVHVSHLIYMRGHWSWWNHGALF